MIIGVPKEVKDHEYRVGMVPGGVMTMVQSGHTVLLEKGASKGSGIDESKYNEAGAQIIDSKKELFSRADMIIKVKEPVAEEFDLLHENQVLFTYLHLAPNRVLTEALLAKKVIGVAYETIEEEGGGLPLLVPMSEIAGKMSVQVGAYCLQNILGGNGTLLGGVPGVLPGKVLILGAGVVGCAALSIAVGMGADVIILDTNINKLRTLEEKYGNRIKTLFSTEYNIGITAKECDLLIGAVLVHGAKAPTLIGRKHLKSMKPGSVVVDVAIDQGGCIETCRPTTHSNPTYVVDGVVHYCVTNIPGAVAHTSTFALTNATIRLASDIANLGVEVLARKNPHFARGINVYKGHATYKPVADSLGIEYTNLFDLIGK